MALIDYNESLRRALLDVRDLQRGATFTASNAYNTATTATTTWARSNDVLDASTYAWPSDRVARYTPTDLSWDWDKYRWLNEPIMTSVEWLDTFTDLDCPARHRCRNEALYSNGINPCTNCVHNKNGKTAAFDNYIEKELSW